MNKRIILSAITITALCTACVPQVTTNAHGSSAQSWGLPSSSTPSPAAARPTAADFLVDVVVTKQHCFGSAGCNVTYTLNPQYIGAKELPEKTTVIYKITGGDQDQVGNFTIDKSGMASFDRETMISAPEGANLQAVVTAVLPGR